MNRSAYDRARNQQPERREELRERQHARNLRPDASPARVVSFDRLTLAERGRLLATRTPRALPMLRVDCETSARPCPYVSCRHHLFLDVTENGNLRINFPDAIDEDGEIDFSLMPRTCSLDVADEGGVPLEHIGALMNVTRERVRQIEEGAIEKLQELPPKFFKWGTGAAEAPGFSFPSRHDV